MGFRCPKCKQDFALDKDALTRHLLTSPNCALVSSILLSEIEEIVKQLDEDCDPK